jgi:Zinc carboxypeptidase
LTEIFDTPRLPDMFVRSRLLAGAAGAVVAASLTLVVSGPSAAARAAQPAVRCSDDPAAHLPAVPSPADFLGFPLGAGQPRVVTNAEINGYLAAVDRASHRVVTGTMARSVNGQALPYAIVSSERNIGRLDALARQIRALRDPRSTDPRVAARIAADLPAVVWVTGNVHGGETSGADGTLKALYELAAGLDCEAWTRNANLVTVVVPTQNPDGRDAGRRQNEFGFDLNRDWFARTQPETAGKIDLLRAYPPQVYVDAHEMGGRQFFFPPNADPIHHEIPGEAVDWINRIGAANAAAFGYNGACSAEVSVECYFNYDVYDLFFMGYGDSVPAAGFGAAGMTYEKGSASAVEDRVTQQFTTQWATLGWAAANRREVLDGYYRTWRTAVAQGRAGALEPNEVVQPGNTVQFPVPPVAVRSYFLLPDRQLGDARRLVERLRGMDVEVYRLRAPVTVPDARVFGGRSARNLRVPAGAYWIPMDQPQKHWIQAIMGEDPYVPFPYFYDVSSWSNPLLMGVPTVYTGDRLRPLADRVTGPDGGVVRQPGTRSYTYPLDSSAAAGLTFALLGRGVPVRRDLGTGVVGLPTAAAPRDLDRLARSAGVTVTASRAPARGTPLEKPDVGLFAGTGISTTSGSYGEARFVLGDQWGLDPTPVTTADVNGNTAAFTDRDVLLVPDGSSATGGLDAAGLANLRAWVAAGGTYLGLRNEGTRVARAAGLTSTVEVPKPAEYQVLGSHFRVDVAPASPASPIGSGRPAEDFEFNNSDPILSASTTGTNVLRYPPDERFWFNGYAVQAEVLKGTAALVDEPLGTGRAVLFAYNPLFRAYNESGLHLVANALLAPPAPAAAAPPAPPALPAPEVDRRRQAAARAAAAGENLGGEWRPITIQVAAADRARVSTVVESYTATARVSEAGGSAYFLIPNPDGRQADEHPFLRELLRDLRAGQVPLRSVVG